MFSCIYIQFTSHNVELEAGWNNLLQQQTIFQKISETFQNRNDENFFLLANEIQETQESVAKITEVVNDNLHKLDVYLREIKRIISQHLAQTMNFYQQLLKYISYLNPSHVKS